MKVTTLKPSFTPISIEIASEQELRVLRYALDEVSDGGVYDTSIEESAEEMRKSLVEAVGEFS